MTVFYNGTEYETTSKELEMKNPHSVLEFCFGNHKVGYQLYTAKASCYCEACSKGENCGRWKIDTVPEKHNVSNEASLCECSLKRKLTDHEGNVDENRKKVQKLNIPEMYADRNGSSHIADENVLPKVSDKNESPLIKPVKDQCSS
ncbi:hypothetical protein DPMN_068111 [Dreissena polymorpha]|uniref:Uncharacterized protein n=1 Tax=Dreissena polymorpha TaxID=45954 RepID=A0A9D3YZ70_DREPO|nr:hypothetical protein DPMN_068111 [Dreissena polymorpha]